MLDPVRLYRLYHLLWRRRVPIVPWALYRLNMFLTACDLPPSARVGPNAVFRHWGLGVAITPNTEVGEGAIFFSHARVTCTPNATRAKVRIGPRAQLGVGSIVLASKDLDVGADAQIGAGALVREPVQPKVTVLGCDDPLLRRSLAPSSPSAYRRDSHPTIPPEMLHRWSRRLYMRRVPVLPSLVYRLNYLINRVILPPNMAVGRRVRISRWATLSTTTIGDDVVIEPGVITARNVRHGRATPLSTIAIQNGAVIEAAAIIVGTDYLEIGEDARVAEGAVVTKSVPPGCTASGIPARIVSRPSEETAP